MKYFPVFILFILIVLFQCTSEQPANSTIDLEKDRKYLTYLKEVNWPKAYREQNEELLNSILADEFQMVRNDGVWSNKKKEIEFIRNNPPSYDTLYFEIKRLDVFENGSAIVAGTGHVFRMDDNGEEVEAEYQSTNVLIKRKGAWKAVSSHVSGYKILE